MKRKNPSTSLEAHARLDPIKVSQTMTKITDTLKSIGKGNYEDISAAAQMPEAKCWKRLIDCVRAGLIHRTDAIKMTKNGYKSYLYAPGGTPEPVKKKERVMRGKSVVDYSKSILNQPKQSIHTQDQLF
jgi:hypothetical protein